MKTSTFFRILLRSFFIQGSFSFTYRQNTGFAFCMEPVGKELWKEPEEKRSFLLRHLEYYNGNPFMITLVLGGVARLEEMHKNGEIGEEKIAGFKKAVGAATGSIGDRFFWAALRPLSIIIGFMAAYVIGIWGIVITLALFNVPNVLLRWYWLRRGYYLGTAIVQEIQNKKIQTAIGAMETSVAVLLAFISVVLIGNRLEYGDLTVPIGGALLFVASTFIFMQKRGVLSALAISLACVCAYGFFLTFV